MVEPLNKNSLPNAYSAAEVQIFEAALKCFARKGKDGARMQEIADEAGINKAMLHYYFRSKDRLYHAVVGYVMRQFLASLEGPLRGADTFRETLRRFIDAYMDFVAGHPDVLKLLISENLSGGEVMGEHVRALVEASDAAPPRLFAARIAEAVARGEIRPVNPLQMLLTTVSGCVLPFLMMPTLRVFAPGAVTRREAFLEARKDHLFEVLYEGLRPHP